VACCYDSTVGECFAVVQGVKHYYTDLLGKEFTILTDHLVL
jgi:hypothetical protein